MREKVTKVVKMNKVSHTWTDGKKPVIIFYADHELHKIGFITLSGCDPTIDDIMNICSTDRDILMELRWAFTEYKRKDACFFREYAGVSGCREISFHTSHAPEWTLGWRFANEERFKLRISMYGKVNYFPEMFSGDLLELMEYLYIAHIYDEDNERPFYLGMKDLAEHKCKTIQAKPCYRYLKFHNHMPTLWNPICGSY